MYAVGGGPGSFANAFSPAPQQGGMGGLGDMMRPQSPMLGQNGPQVPWQKVLQGLRAQQDTGQDNGMSGLLPLLSMLYGGSSGFNPQAQQIAQNGLGMANQSALSLMNPNYGKGGF